MKTPVSLIWIPSLVLSLAWLPDSLAQNDSKRPTTSETAPAVRTSTPLSVNDSPDVQLSHWSTEIVKLSQARINESVMLAYIASSGAFQLDPGQIIHLKELGVSAPIITAMLQHDQDFASSPKPLLAANESEPHPAAAPAVAAPAFENLIVTADEPEQTLPEAGRTIPQPLFSAPQSAPAQRGAFTDSPEVNPGVPAPEKNQDLYPVREPYPVELTAPIIFVRAPEIVPNTFVIVGFPPTTP